MPGRVTALTLFLFVLAFILCAADAAHAQSGTSAGNDSTGRAQDSILSSAFMALAKDSTLIEEYQKIVGIYKARKQFQQELVSAEHMTTAIPSSPIAYYTLADAELDNGDPDAAIGALNKAITIEPSFPKALVLMAEAYSMNKKSDSALLYLNKAIDLNPRYAQAQLQRATLLSGLGREREALESYRAASELLPDSYDAWYKYARSLLKTGDTTDLLETLRYVNTLNEHSADARLLYAQACAAVGRKEEAIKAYEFFILNFPADPRSLEAERIARGMGWKGPH